MIATDSFWQGKRVLCTGATGVVGGWLVRLLLGEGAEVVALIRDVDYRSELYRSADFRRIAIVNGELQDFGTVERAINEHEVDTVVHLGAQTIVSTAQRSPLPTFEANIRGTYNLLDACRMHPELVQRVVVASSDKAYGDNDGKPYDEGLSPLAAKHPYEVSKTCADLLAQSYAHSYGLPVAIARCGNIYGGGDLNWSRLVPGTIRSLALDRRPEIRSDGTYIRDYLYVKDAAAAYLTLARHAADEGLRGQAFNFSAECPRSALDMVELIARLMAKQHLEPLVLNVAHNEIKHQTVSARKAREQLGWQANHDLETGLRESIDWYLEFLGARSAIPAYV